MMSRHTTETLLGALVLAVAGYFLAVLYQQSDWAAGSSHYPLQASFLNVTGVSEGSDVRIGGVKVGRVAALSLDSESYRAVMRLHLRQDIRLPQDSSAAIVSESLLGNKFVAITPGGMETMLEPGDTLEFTQSTVNLEQLLGKFVFGGDEQGDGQGLANSDGSEDGAPRQGGGAGLNLQAP